MANAFPYRICFVEDASTVYEPIKLGMEVLLGAEVDHFSTTDSALRSMNERGYDQWQVFVFDNRTGPGAMPGIELAHRIKANCEDAIVVSLNSSDLHEMLEYGADKLHDEGIEFWYKVSESFLMIAWLADCAKQGHMIPRQEWLKSIGESTNFQLPEIHGDRPKDRELRIICMRLRDGHNSELEGILMSKNVVEYLQELTDNTRGPERR